MELWTGVDQEYRLKIITDIVIIFEVAALSWTNVFAGYINLVMIII